MELSELSQLIGESELERGSIDWSSIELEFGIKFPFDYRQWAESYNSIVICHELVVYNYADGISGIDRDELISMTKVYEGSRTGFTFERDQVYDSRGVLRGSGDVLPLYPQDGGLILWGEDGSGYSYYWETSDPNPNRWRTVVTDNEAFWQEFDFGFLEFLVRLLSHDIDWPTGVKATWPWIPAFQECESREGDEFRWYIPQRWSSYFAEVYRREKTQMNFDDFG